MFRGIWISFFFFFFQAEDGIRDVAVTGVQTCALPISLADAGVERAAQKLGEEGVEAAIAATAKDGRLVSEAADVLFHLYVLLAVAGIDIADVEAELATRRR